MPLVQMNLNAIFYQRRTLQGESNVNGKNNEEKSKKEIAKKCLFGPSNPDETKKMLEEQFEDDRKRFLDRYDVDILELERDYENYEKNFEKEKNGKIVRVSRKRKSMENVLKPYNKQARLTDIFQVRKRCQSVLKDKEEF